jgi:hypothetical protein
LTWIKLWSFRARTDLEVPDQPAASVGVAVLVYVKDMWRFSLHGPV